MDSDGEEECVNRGGAPELVYELFEYEPRIEIVGVWNVEDGLKSQITEFVKSAFTKFDFKNEIVNAIHDELREKIGGGWICVISRDELVTNNINATSTESRENTVFGMDRGTVAKKSRKRRNSNTDNTSQQAENEPVFFSNDTILEAVKFLNYVKWSKMRFLCRRVNQTIHSNQFKLQAFEVKSFGMTEIVRSSNSIVSFDQAILSPDAVRKWFQDHGYSCDETVDLPLEKVFAGMNLSGKNSLHFTIRAFYEEYKEKNMPLTRSEAKRTGKLPKIDRCLSNSVILRSMGVPQVFSAKISDKHELYGPILYHLFRLLHHPAAYYREVSMFPVMTDKFCDMTVHSPIKCNQFTLLVSHSTLSYSSLEQSLNWLKDNVRAQQIILSSNFRGAILVSDLHSLILEFILQDASICAQDSIKLDSIPQPKEFVNALIKKYETLEVTKAIPTIVLEFRLSWHQTIKSFVNPNLVPQYYPPLYDKYCVGYDIKTYELQNKMDVNRKMIAQYWNRWSHCTLYVKFE